MVQLRGRRRGFRRERLFGKGRRCGGRRRDRWSSLRKRIFGSRGCRSWRDLAAGAKRSLWLRTKQGYLAEGLPLLLDALQEIAEGVKGVENRAVILESNSLMQFVKPSLYFAVIDPLREDFKESAQIAL